MRVSFLMAMQSPARVREARSRAKWSVGRVTVTAAWGLLWCSETRGIYFRVLPGAHTSHRSELVGTTRWLGQPVSFLRGWTDLGVEEVTPASGGSLSGTRARCLSGEPDLHFVKESQSHDKVPGTRSWLGVRDQPRFLFFSNFSGAVSPFSPTDYPLPLPVLSPALLSMPIVHAHMHISSVVYLPPPHLLGIVSLYPTSTSLGLPHSSDCYVHYIPQISEIISYLSFSVWLVLLRIILSRSLHVFSKDKRSFFLTAA
uniref:Uncharacterized protein n=1 Tax=Molossus molossus TaxID=27622 RepID=A0A7J8E2H6_MOLMO|nr:hypothetical protein HJG59_008979 [Molossus molossus]